MKRKELVLLISILWIAIGVASCGLDMPKEVKTSFETMNVKKQDITIPMKFSARLKGQADCQAAREKHGYYHRQVEVLREAYNGTHELMDNGKSNYLEVLTAQESLLSAQLSEAMNMYNGAQAVIALYIALGGGTK